MTITDIWNYDRTSRTHLKRYKWRSLGRSLKVCCSVSSDPRSLVSIKTCEESKTRLQVRAKASNSVPQTPARIISLVFTPLPLRPCQRTCPPHLRVRPPTHFRLSSSARRRVGMGCGVGHKDRRVKSLLVALRRSTLSFWLVAVLHTLLIMAYHLFANYSGHFLVEVRFRPCLWCW